MPDVDLRDLDRWVAEGPPDEWFRARRADAPIHWQPDRDGGPGFWAVLGHQEVSELGRYPHAMSSDADNGGVAGLGPGDELQDALDTGLEAAAVGADTDAKMLLTLDPPDHTASRKLLNRGFTPAAIGRLEVGVRELTQTLLDGLEVGAPVDFTAEVAMPLPMRVIGDLLGADRDTHADLLRWSNEAVAGTDPEYRTDGGSQIGAAIALAQFFLQIREERTAATRAGVAPTPDDDIISVLIDSTIDGQPLSDVRYTIYLLMLAIAGNETTRNALSHGVWAFADHPDQWERLRDDPSLLSSAVDEVLRWSSPVLYFRRNALAEMTVGGVTIEPGDLVSLWYVSANRDETVFTDPDRFDVGRDPNPHVSFGGGGPHFCLGASLARLEIRTMLEALSERFTRIERCGEPIRLRSNFLHGIKHLPVRFHP